MADDGKPNLKIWLGGIAGAVVLFAIVAPKAEPVEVAKSSEQAEETVAAVEPDTGPFSADKPLATSPVTAVQRAESAPVNDWDQYTRDDELRGTTDRFADVTSTNSVDFDFPYCCGSRLEMTVRKTSQYGTDVIFQISDGQFVCGIYDCAGTISFDGKPESLSLNRSADHDSKILFAKYPDAIVRKLKKSDRVIVELPFYQEGNRQFKFNTHGLDWK